MYIFLKVRDLSHFPSDNNFVDTMWEPGLSISRSGILSSELKECSVFSFAWNKWVDDDRWKNQANFKAHIYFYMNTDFVEDEDIALNEGEILIEAEDPVLMVDKRAVYLAAILIAKTCNGTISIDKDNWMTVDEFEQTVQEILSFSFKEAVEISLQEAITG
jgi:hypothetical protein